MMTHAGSESDERLCPYHSNSWNTTRDVKASRPKIWPQPRNSLASASRFWPRDILATTARHRSFRSQAPMNRPNNFCAIIYINSDTSDHSLSGLAKFYCDFSVLQPLFDRLLCIPASSAVVERVFSQSGLIMTARRARMSNAVLESLVFLKCNADSSATKCLHCISEKPVTQA